MRFKEIKMREEEDSNKVDEEKILVKVKEEQYGKEEEEECEGRRKGRCGRSRERWNKSRKE